MSDLRPLMALAVLTLAACSPQGVVDSVTQSAARSVVVPVLATVMPDATAEVAAVCVVEAATPDELAGLARDVGTRAGTTTVATVRQIAATEATRACLARRGLPPITL